MFLSRVLTVVVEHGLKLLLVHVFVIPDLVRVRGYIDIRREEQNIVDLVRALAQHT